MNFKIKAQSMQINNPQNEYSNNQFNTNETFTPLFCVNKSHQFDLEKLNHSPQTSLKKENKQNLSGQKKYLAKVKNTSLLNGYNLLSYKNQSLPQTTRIDNQNKDNKLVQQKNQIQISVNNSSNLKSSNNQSNFNEKKKIIVDSINIDFQPEQVYTSPFLNKKIPKNSTISYRQLPTMNSQNLDISNLKASSPLLYAKPIGTINNIQDTTNNSGSLSVCKAKTSNIKTYVRFRPLNVAAYDKETDENYCVKFLKENQVATINDGITFKADRIFGPKSTQQELYDVISKELVQEALDGYNTTIFAYGQTGSGKTYSMFGELKDQNKQGIIPRIVQDLFNKMDSNKYQLKCSMLEIYNENLFDLLDQEINEEALELRIKEDPIKGIYVQNLKKYVAKNVNDVFYLLNLGNNNKIQRGTKMNDYSSRSHTIFTIYLTINDQITKVGKINLIDLAGSEKLKKSKAEGQALQETKKINFSLSALGNVISALVRKDHHAPFRDSKLTRILQDSLNGNFKTQLLINCSPHITNLEETQSSLKFALRVQALKTTYRVNIKDNQQNLELVSQQMHQKNSKLERNNQAFRALFQQIKKELGNFKNNNFNKLKNKLIKLFGDMEIDNEPNSGDLDNVFEKVQQNSVLIKKLEEQIQELSQSLNSKNQDNLRLIFENQILNEQIKDMINKNLSIFKENKELKENLNHKIVNQYNFLNLEQPKLDLFVKFSDNHASLFNNVKLQLEDKFLKYEIVKAYLINKQLVSIIKEIKHQKELENHQNNFHCDNLQSSDKQFVTFNTDLSQQKNDIQIRVASQEIKKMPLTMEETQQVLVQRNQIILELLQNGFINPFTMKFQNVAPIQNEINKSTETDQKVIIDNLKLQIQSLKQQNVQDILNYHNEQQECLKSTLENINNEIEIQKQQLKDNIREDLKQMNLIYKTVDQKLKEFQLYKNDVNYIFCIQQQLQNLNNYLQNIETKTIKH